MRYVNGFVLFVGGLTVIGGVRGAEPAERPSITVTGKGQVATRPDRAEVEVSLVSQAETASQALSRSSQALAELQAALIKEGVDANQVRATRFHLDTRQPWPKEHVVLKAVQTTFRDGQADTPRDRPIDKPVYQASNLLRVGVADLTQLPRTLALLAESESHTISGITLGTSQRAELLRQARIAALADARRAAETYAQSAGASLGPLLSVREEAAGATDSLSGADLAEGAPTLATEDSLEVVITAAFAIRPATNEPREKTSPTRGP